MPVHTGRPTPAALELTMTDTAHATLDTAARILARQLPMPRWTVDNPAADVAIGEPNGDDQLD
jgi:hypothetical protein